jgi:hypothetical protein
MGAVMTTCANQFNSPSTSGNIKQKKYIPNLAIWLFYLNRIHFLYDWTQTSLSTEYPSSQLIT